jgi:hypothetical protein
MRGSIMSIMGCDREGEKEKKGKEKDSYIE